MVAMYERAFHTFPFVLVHNHRSSHPNVSQTLVRPDKDNTLLTVLEIKPFGRIVSQGPIQFADTEQRRYVL